MLGLRLVEEVEKVLNQYPEQQELINCFVEEGLLVEPMEWMEWIMMMIVVVLVQVSYVSLSLIVGPSYALVQHQLSIPLPSVSIVMLLISLLHAPVPVLIQPIWLAHEQATAKSAAFKTPKELIALRLHVRAVRR